MQGDEGTTYIAGPYTHPDSAVKELRYQLLSQVSLYFMNCGQDVFSPITHGHAMEVAGVGPNKPDYKTWILHGLKHLQKCDRMYVCDIPGTDDSSGVDMEIRWCIINGIPYQFLDEDMIQKMDTVDNDILTRLEELELK